jgi:hypothetical protein
MKVRGTAVDRHKTKLLGALTAALGFIQGYPGLSSMLEPKVYAWVMFAVGMLVVVCGFLNTMEEPPVEEEEDNAQ